MANTATQYFEQKVWRHCYTHISKIDEVQKGILKKTQLFQAIEPFNFKHFYLDANFRGIKFRDLFEFGDKHLFESWFPVHMAKGLEKMKQKLHSVDCIIEVHDARLPLSGRNPILNSIFETKPRLIVLNKADLIKANTQQYKAVYDHYKKEGADDVLFTNCEVKDKKSRKVHVSISKIIPSCVKMIKNSPQYHLSGTLDYHIMVVGIPNVGKSSLIKGIRHHYLNKLTGYMVDKSPGYTKSLSNRMQVCNNPCVYLFDTPGVIQPKILDMDTGIKLAACNTLSSQVVGIQLIMDYLLYFLNKNKQFKYVNYFELPVPCDNARAVLTFISKKKNFGESNLPNLEAAATVFVNAYRNGYLGKFLLDDLD